VLKKVLVLGAEYRFYKHPRNVREMNEASSLALFSGNVEHELWFEAVPVRLDVSVSDHNPADVPLVKIHARRFGPEE
jgi:hypothetical protein